MTTTSQRECQICEKIIFNSGWSRSRFIEGLDNFYSGSPKLEVINQSTDKPNIDFTHKEIAPTIENNNTNPTTKKKNIFV